MQNLHKGIIHLQKDPILADVIKKFGVLNYPASPDRFESLVGSIIGQQLSNKAADTIYDRFEKLVSVVTPENILKMPDDILRSCGTSWAKIRSLKDLSQKILDKSVLLNQLDLMNDEEVIIHLTQVKGIGRWTAEMKLMFTLLRPDVLPIDDVGIQNAFVKHYGLNRKHKTFTKKMQKIAETWRPFRTLACWYLWKSLDNQ